MKNNARSSNSLKGLVWGVIIFFLLFYVGFGAVNFSIQQRSFQQSSYYVVNRLEQLQLNLEVLQKVYIKEHGLTHPVTQTIVSLVEEIDRIQTYDELDSFIPRVEVLRKERTYSKEAKQHIQKVLAFNLYVNTKLMNGWKDLQVRRLSYIGASRIFPGIQLFFPIDSVNIPRRST
ncbi:MAG: hypothetical protein PHX86_05140 [Caldisericia bacterium]|nr:hypothetical protein [Caldisericia bacterium]